MYHKKVPQAATACIPSLMCVSIVNKQSEPYLISAHQYHIRVDSSPSPVPVTSYGKIQLTLIGDSDINETFTLTQ
jgi:hypothetical protein